MLVGRVLSPGRADTGAIASLGRVRGMMDHNQMEDGPGHRRAAERGDGGPVSGLPEGPGALPLRPLP